MPLPERWNCADEFLTGMDGILCASWYHLESPEGCKWIGVTKYQCNSDYHGPEVVLGRIHVPNRMCAISGIRPRDL